MIKAKKMAFDGQKVRKCVYPSGRSLTGSREHATRDDRRVCVNQEDFESLDPEQFLTDGVLEFWMRWIEEHLPTAVRARMSFASPLYFSMLPSPFIDIDLSKEFTFVPVYHEEHWSLAIVIRDDCVLHLDSLSGSHHTRKILTPLNKKLDIEALVRLGPGSLPRQNNIYDCGLFMLTYIDFFCHAVGSESKLCHEELSGLLKAGKEMARRRIKTRHGQKFLSKTWFELENAGSLRDRIRAELLTLMGEQAEESDQNAYIRPDSIYPE